jgi:hypothetical protein
MPPSSAADRRRYNRAMGITADTKDWTWVLERPCPECGFNEAQFPREDLGPFLRSSAERWSEELSRSDATRRPSDDQWSVLEYGCHARDVFRIFNVRVTLMLNVDDPVFENWDQDATAVEDRYDLQNPLDVQKELVEAAFSLADVFEHVTPEQWNRPGARSNGSQFTVESIGKYLAHDVVHHLWDVSTF